MAGASPNPSKKSKTETSDAPSEAKKTRTSRRKTAATTPAVLDTALDGADGGSSATRPPISDRDKLAVYASAAGRCTFCNRIVIENDELGLSVPIGELAHNVGWGKKSPRGDSAMSEAERAKASNLLLLCRNCHKPIDDKGVIGKYTVEVLDSLKREHERRIRFLTEIGGDRQAVVVRVVGQIRGINPELTYDTVLEATTSEGIFPTLLPNAYQSEIELDLRSVPDDDGPEYFNFCTRQIDTLSRRISEGVRLNSVSRVAVFAFARMSLLVHLGARLDDKVSVVVFQRRRVDGANAWKWPEGAVDPPAFKYELVREGKKKDQVALIINLSGTIGVEELPTEVLDDHNIYCLTPEHPSKPDVSIISSPAALASFAETVRAFLGQLEAEHGRLTRIAVFPTLPLAAAVTLGRVVMTGIGPALSLYERNSDKQFYHALEVST